MTHDRPYYLLRHIPAPRLRDADSSVRPHTYGVRVGLCAAFATNPCRPTACIPAAPFRHTPYSFRPRLNATLWRNLQQHPQCADATTTLHSPFSILNSSFSHTFSAKERDLETGLSYFGARYYSSDLSIWLSVDPMSDKYPSLSPYVYCADNPVKLVDPNGEDYEVFIISDNEQTADKAFKQLQSSTNLILERDKDGRITIIGGEVRNDNDMLLKKAINDKSIIVKINAINGTSNDYVIGGAFMGNDVVDKETPLYGAKPYNVIALMFSRRVYTKQTVDPYETEILDEIGYDHYVLNGPKIKASPGQTILHEVTESYCGGVDAFFSGISAGNATVSPSAYESAHNAATYQPDILMDIPDVLNIFRERRGK